MRGCLSEEEGLERSAERGCRRFAGRNPSLLHRSAWFLLKVRNVYPFFFSSLPLFISVAPSDAAQRYEQRRSRPGRWKPWQSSEPVNEEMGEL